MSNGRVEGKVAIVTGAASGLGEADAELLVQHGAQVIITDLNQEAGAAVAERIGATFIAQDVAEEEDWKKVFALALERFGKCDILVNNAAISTVANIEQTSLGDYRRIQKVNSDGVFLGCKYGIQAISKNAQGGSIINLSSLAAARAFPEVIAYSASKGAVRALTMTIAAHCLKAGYPIRCNAILPGSTATPLQQKTAQERGGVVEAGMDNGRQRIGKPSDIANLVVYLASDESVQITGQEFIVDGGYSIQ